MERDDEGFLYPKVDESICVECGVCGSICPWIDSLHKDNSSHPVVYAAKHKDDDIRKKSTSGGVFSLFATKVLQKGGFVYGASFVSEHQQIEHICISHVDELEKLRGSKYVQSSPGSVFRDIRTKLKNKCVILYTGTPCQCAGLRRFLRKDYENLYIIDILCHSVPSPRVFSDMLESTGGELSTVSFRDKSKGWRYSYQLKLFRDKEIILKDNSFLTMFFKGLINRPSCYHCKFTTVHRVGDMTIGDYWNINIVNPQFEDALGVSCLLINTEKGKSLFNEVSDSLEFIQTDLVSAIQTCMTRHVTEPHKRQEFWRDYNKYGFAYCERKYGTMSLWERLRDRFLAPFVRKIRLAVWLRKY